jgi:serine/threonine-protein kinase RsbW
VVFAKFRFDQRRDRDVEGSADGTRWEACGLFKSAFIYDALTFGVINMAHTPVLRLASQALRPAPYIELQRSFPSDLRAMSACVDQLMRFILSFRSTDGSEIEIEAALREAVANAVVHGNSENPCKRVYVECRCYKDGEVSITVRDEGSGFALNTVPDPTMPENRMFTHGRGIYLMEKLMDEVTFERSGAVVHMRKIPNRA